MIEVFVCDDDETITDYLKFFLLKHYMDQFNVLSFNSCNDLIGMVQINERIPDILIMDVNLGDKNGIETVKEIQREHPDVKVIYLTGIIDYAVDIFQTNPSYFLTKPINENKLRDAINKTVKKLEYDRSDAIVIKTNGSEALIYRRDVIYVESRGRKIIIYLNNGNEISVYEKMDAIQNQLGSSFVRCHKSFLINMKYISERINQEFYLMNGKVLPISKSNLKDSKIKFIAYLGDNT